MRDVLFTVLCSIGTATCYLLYQYFKYRDARHRKAALFFKGTATLFAAVLAVYGAAAYPGAGQWLIAAGLVVCAAADVALDVRFLPGMALFGLGHVLYCTAYVFRGQPRLESLIVFSVLAVFCLIRYPKLKKYAGSKSPIPYLCYALLLCAMLGLAVSQRGILLLGAACFVLSDSMLAYRLMMKVRSRPYDYLLLLFYYGGQLLIGASNVWG